jgi:hypothetical protein
MKNMRARLLIFFIAIIFLHLQVAAQQPLVSASADRNRIFLGEQFTMTLLVEVGLNDRPVVFPVLPDTLNHLEVIKRKAVDSVRSGDRLRYTQEIVLTGFDSGMWSIPPQVVKVKGKDYRTGILRVAVMNVPLSGEGYNDIKDIIPVTDGGFNWKKWLLVLATVLVVFFAVRYWWNQRRSAPPAIPQVSRSTAFEEAMANLKKIQQEKANEKGEIKAYYSSIYDVFRTYLTRVSGKPFMQYTTDEILMGSKNMLPPDKFSSTAEVMRITDAVKFAKYQSDLNESVNSLERVRSGIEEINRQKRSLDQ